MLEIDHKDKILAKIGNRSLKSYHRFTRAFFRATSAIKIVLCVMSAIAIVFSNETIAIVLITHETIVIATVTHSQLWKKFKVERTKKLYSKYFCISFSFTVH